MDTWTAVDLPLLRALVDHFTGRNAPAVRFPYADLLPGIETSDVQDGIARLARARPPYIAALGTDEDDLPAAITGVHERAMRDSGQWPSPDEMVRRVAEALLAAAEKEPDAEQADRARKVASWVAGLASGTGSGVAAAALARAFGVG